MKKYIVAYQNTYEGGFYSFDSYEEALKHYNEDKKLWTDLYSSIVLAEVIEKPE